MEITETVDPKTRARWRAWLREHHADKREIWLLYRRGKDGGLTYLDAVEEALCFGWIDGLAKRQGDLDAQRFTPRRKNSNWTELNKERARRLIKQGLMTEAGLAVAPDLDAPFALSTETEQALRADHAVWTTWSGFPDLYRRVRGSYVDEVRTRDPKQYEKRLRNLVEKTRDGRMFGNWDDAEMPRSGYPASALASLASASGSMFDSTTR